MSESSDAVKLETRDHVGCIRLNRPQKKNALSDELGWAIVNAVVAAAGRS